MTTSLQQLRDLVSEHDIRVVVSDLDGVLRIFDQSQWGELDELAGAESGAVFAAVLGHPYLAEVIRGRGDHARWRERSTRRLVEIGCDPDAAREAVETWAATPAVVDLDLLHQLLAFREAGLGVFVLTNGTDRIPEELDELGLTDFLGDDRRFLLNTADLGAAKPDPEAFERAHARIERELGTTLQATHVAFLDDSERHVRGAGDFGWHAIQHLRD